MPSGSCICGDLQYEYTGEPTLKANCQCLTCRKLSGGTNIVAALIPEDDFHVKSGTPKTFTTTHEVGIELTVSFCGRCGTNCFKTSNGFEGLVIVFAGTLDGGGLEQLKPQAELWNKYRVSWLPELKGTMQADGFLEAAA